MELIFLGTSAGAPTKTRNVTGLAVRRAGSRSWCLVDCGEGTQHRILHTNLSLRALDAICITHVHGDHCFGLPGLLDSAGMQGRTEPLAIYGPQPIARFISAAREASGSWEPFPIDFHPIEHKDDEFGAGEFVVSRHALSHRVPCFAYAFREAGVERKLDVEAVRARGVPPGPLWKALQSGADIELGDGSTVRAEDVLQPARRARKIVVGGDNDTPSLLHDACRDADVLVHEATYTMEVANKVGPGPQHCVAQVVAEFARDAGLPNLVLTHFSARYQDDPAGGQSIAEIEAEARGSYAGRLFLAGDLQTYRLDKHGLLEQI
ncbi:MAG TPA: ribonuclease Z [Burkholderiaceae bacterium]